MEFALVLKLIELGLELWIDSRKTEIQRRYLFLKESWYAEYNKPDTDRSDAVMDNIKFELRQLIDTFASQARTSNTPAKQ